MSSHDLALNGEETAVLLLTGRMELKFANAPAMKLMETQDIVACPGGVLKTSSLQGWGAFKRTVGRQAVRGLWAKEVAVCPLRTRYGEEWIAQVYPAGSGQAIVILLQRGAQWTPELNMIRSCLRLTDAEAKLARALWEVETLAEACAELGISINTGKSQLRSIFNRLGISRQATLLKMLALLPARRISSQGWQAGWRREWAASRGGGGTRRE